jgi:hypothetical protein
MNVIGTDPTRFIEDWIEKTKRDHPDSAAVQALRQATKAGQLDEAGLLRKLRDLSKPAATEGRNDQR